MGAGQGIRDRVVYNLPSKAGGLGARTAGCTEEQHNPSRCMYNLASTADSVRGRDICFRLQHGIIPDQKRWTAFRNNIAYTEMHRVARVPRCGPTSASENRSIKGVTHRCVDNRNNIVLFQHLRYVRRFSCHLKAVHRFSHAAGVRSGSKTRREPTKQSSLHRFSSNGARMEA